MTLQPSSFMAILGDREALGWVLREQKMAFGPERWRLWRSLKQGDALALYTTRQCFRNPTRDRGRVIASAIIASPLQELEMPIEFRKRPYNFYCDLKIDQLAPWGQGPELVTMVSELKTFPSAWGSHIRRSLVQLDEHDYGVLTRALAMEATTRDEALDGYLARALPLQPKGRPARKVSQ
ncbi:hypothetical protein ACIBKY_00035 [Nonomuraea sp. NPDC050394]|uniref:hypothetical protein n=1 Tax=Nonomuraea sp. NPDC050394 TaxID=3364363 RepID=UPI003793DE7C